MEIKKYEFLLRADEPIHHGFQTFGNHSTIMRRKERMPDGSFTEVPAVSGDAMRHLLRESITYALLDAADMKGEALTEAVLRLLFSGGMLTGKGDASIVKLDEYRELCELIPPLALFGGCVNNRCIPGRLIVGSLVLVCEETKHKLPAWVLEHSGRLDGARAHVEIEQRVRMDPLLDPVKRKLLTAGALADLETRMGQSEAAHEDDNEPAAERTKSTMMPRTCECVASGSLFLWRVEAICLTDLDVDTFNVTCASALARARVGGKQGTEHGQLRCIAAQAVLVDRPADRLHAVDTTQLAPKVGELFRAHVRERKERLRDILSRVDA